MPAAALPLSVANICDLYATLYTSLPVPHGTWDAIFPVDGAYCAVKHVANTYYVCFRGSTTFLDWIEDFDMLGVPIFTHSIGFVHPGFFAGVMAVKDNLDMFMHTPASANKPSVVIVGHSLGAGHAALYAALRVSAGLPVTQLVMFGEPRAGTAKLGEILAAAKVDVASYRNQTAQGHDFVTDVPPAIPPLTHYQNVLGGAFTLVAKPPAVGDSWGPFAHHHFGMYAQALGAASDAAKSLPGYS